MLQVVWFRRDLRVVDHVPLLSAAEEGVVLPLYAVDAAYWKLPAASARTFAFERDAVMDLSRQLKALQQPLIIRRGSAPEVLRSMHERFGIAAVWSHEDGGKDWEARRSRGVAEFCRQAGIVWHQMAPGSDAGRPPLPAPDRLKSLTAIVSEAFPAASEFGFASDRLPSGMRGGRTAALRLLERMLTGRGRPQPAAAANLSLHLANGSLSLRETMHRCLGVRSQLVMQGDAGALAKAQAIDVLLNRLAQGQAKDTRAGMADAPVAAMSSALMS